MSTFGAERTPSAGTGQLRNLETIMMADIDVTHDPTRKSWVASANAPSTDFPIQNLPFCMFARPGEAKRAGVAIGEECARPERSRRSRPAR